MSTTNFEPTAEQIKEKRLYADMAMTEAEYEITKEK